jgi:preprotein translocase subunit YajC
MKLEGWNPLALLPVAFFAVFIVLAVRRARKRNPRG